jgi:rSAM/selenodomain-associated transferase 1
MCAEGARPLGRMGRSNRSAPPGRPDWTLIVMARVPQPGRVKTRLAGELGAAGAATLHARLLRQTLRRAQRAHGAQIEWWFDGQREAAGAFLHGAKLKRGREAGLFEQRGRDLGRRMDEAITDALRRAGPGARCVLIGSDCPAQSTQDLEQAADALLEHELVLQPASDGGYVLIGMTRPLPELFEAIEWGSASVLARTEAKAAQAGLRLCKLRPLPDLDTPADLREALARGWLEE